MKKFVFCIAILCSFKVFAQSVTSGNCGPKDENGDYTSNCTWSYDAKTHTLNFTGDGYMAEGFGASQDPDTGGWRTNAPWRDLDSQIYHVNVGGNLKNIGGCSIYSFSKLQDLNITAPIEWFGQEVFAHLRDFEIPSTVKTIGAMGLAYTTVDALIIPDSVKTIKAYAFEYAQATSIVLGNSVTGIAENAFVGTNDSLKIFCEDTSENRCYNLISEKNADYADKITKYTRDENGFYHTEDGKLFATADLMAHDTACASAQNCKDVLAAIGQNAPFRVGGKSYNSLTDIAKGNYVEAKRIYTVDEANTAAGKKNKVMIRYR